MTFRTDLAQEAILHTYGTEPPQQGLCENDYTISGFAIHSVEVVTPDVARQLGKPIGRYCTLQIDPLTRRECEAFPRAVEALSGILTDCLQEIPKDAPHSCNWTGKPRHYTRCRGTSCSRAYSGHTASAKAAAVRLMASGFRRRSRRIGTNRCRIRRVCARTL